MNTKSIFIILILSATLVLGIGFLNTYIQNRPFVPAEFTESRLNGAESARQMNQLITSSLQTLSEIEILDRRNDRSQALVLATEELGKNTERTQVAIELSSHMEKMAGFVSQIRPEKARQLSLEAVSAQIAAATRLAVYNSLLADLFETLSLKFRGQATNPAKVEQLLAELNSQAKEINNFNEKFKSLLAEFDKEVGS